MVHDGTKRLEQFWSGTKAILQYYYTPGDELLFGH